MTVAKLLADTFNAKGMGGKLEPILAIFMSDGESSEKIEALCGITSLTNITNLTDEEGKTISVLFQDIPGFAVANLIAAAMVAWPDYVRHLYGYVSTMSHLFNSEFRRGSIRGLLCGANIFKQEKIPFSTEDEKLLQLVSMLAWLKKADGGFIRDEAGVLSNLIAEFVDGADASRRLAISHFLNSAAEWYTSGGGFTSPLTEQVTMEFQHKALSILPEADCLKMLADKMQTVRDLDVLD